MEKNSKEQLQRKLDKVVFIIPTPRVKFIPQYPKLSRKYKKNFLKNLKKLGTRNRYAEGMQEIQLKCPQLPRGHILRKLYNHLHVKSINAKRSNSPSEI